MLHVLSLTTPCAHSWQRLAAVSAQPVVLFGGVKAAAAAEPPEGLLNAASGLYQTFFAQPAIVFDRSLTYMDPATGALTTPISGVTLSPSSVVLILFFAATRGGGIFPDEKPFNLFQRWIRARLKPFGIPFFDLAPNDERRQWQDAWYGEDMTPSDAPKKPGQDVPDGDAERSKDGSQRSDT